MREPGGAGGALAPPFSFRNLAPASAALCLARGPDVEVRCTCRGGDRAPDLVFRRPTHSDEAVMRDEHRPKQDLINEVVGLRKQIADLKEAAVARRRVEDALRASEEHYRALVEQAPAGICRVSAVESSSPSTPPCGDAGLRVALGGARAGADQRPLRRPGRARAGPDAPGIGGRDRHGARRDSVGPTERRRRCSSARGSPTSRTRRTTS